MRVLRSACLDTGRSMRRPDVVAGLLLHLFADARVLFLFVIFRLSSRRLRSFSTTHAERDRSVTDERFILRFVAAGEHATASRVRGGHRVLFVAWHRAQLTVNPIMPRVTTSMRSSMMSCGLFKKRRPSGGTPSPVVVCLRPAQAGRPPVARSKNGQTAVVVGGVDDVIPIGVRVGEQPRLIAGEIALGVGVAGRIQPVPRPALAKRGEASSRSTNSR